MEQEARETLWSKELGELYGAGSLGNFREQRTRETLWSRELGELYGAES